MNLRAVVLSLSFAASMQSFGFTIECRSEDNLQASRYGMDSLKIVSTHEGNQIIINDVVTDLGETLPVQMSPLARPSLQAESFTVIKPIKFGDQFVFNTGSYLSYVQNKLEVRKYKDTKVTLIDFARRARVELLCEMKK